MEPTVTVRMAESGKQRNRCRKWKIAIRLDERGSDGKPIWKRTTFHGTYTQAKQAAYEVERQLAESRPSRGTFSTFSDYANTWNDGRLAVGAIAPQTHAKNAYLLGLMERYIGGIPLCEITPYDINRAYARIKAEKGLTGTTLSCMHTVCWSAMQRAVMSRMLDRNPFDAVDRPRNDTKEREALTTMECTALSAALDKTDGRHIAVLMMMEAGLRRGEACALTWGDIRDGCIHVRHSLARDGTICPPKCGSSRVIPMTARLRRWMRMYADSLPPQPDGWYVVSAAPTPMYPHSLTRWWARHRKDLPVPNDFVLHQLRHTYCTNLARAGVHPSVMQALMGHSTERMTLKVYCHVQAPDLVKAVEMLDAAERSARQRDTSATHPRHDAAFRAIQQQADGAHFPPPTCEDAVVGVTGFEPVAPSV